MLAPAKGAIGAALLAGFLSAPCLFTASTAAAQNTSAAPATPREAQAAQPQNVQPQDMAKPPAQYPPKIGEQAGPATGQDTSASPADSKTPGSMSADSKISDSKTGEALAKDPAVRNSQEPQPNAIGNRMPNNVGSAQTQAAELQDALDAARKAPATLDGTPMPRPNRLASEPNQPDGQSPAAK